MAPIILDDSELMLPPSFRRRRYHRETTTIEAAPSYHSSTMPHPYTRRDLEYEREYEPATITPPRSPVVLHEDRIHKETIIPRDALPPGVAIVSRDEVIGTRRGRSEKGYYREGGSRSEIGSVRDERMSIRDDREREYSMSGAYREPPSEVGYERERPVDYRDVPAHPDGDRVYLDYRHNREGEEPHRVLDTGIGTRHHRVSGNFVSEEEHHHRRRALAEAAGGLGAGALGTGAIGRTVRRGRGERREYRNGHDSRGSSISSSPDRNRGKKIAAGVVGAGAALGLAAAAAHHMRSKSRDDSAYSSDELDEDGRIIRRGRRGTRAESRPRSRSRAKKLIGATAIGAGIAAARHRRNSRSRASSVSSSSDAGSRSNSRHRGRKIAAAAAATGAGIAGVNYIRKRSKSRGAGSRSSSTSSFTSSDNERHPSHKGRKVAAAALGAAATGAALRHHHKKREDGQEELHRGRSRSRSRERGPKSILRKVRSLSMGGRPRRRSDSVSSYNSDSSYSSDDSRRSRRSRRQRPIKRQSTAVQIGKGIAVGVAARAIKNAFENHERRKYEYDSDDSRSSRRSHRSSRKSRPGMGRRIRSRSLGGGGNHNGGWAGKVVTGVAASALEHIVDAANKGGRRR